jgi:hypothetical protein
MPAKNGRYKLVPRLWHRPRHSLALFKGNIQNSFHAHWFGIPALLILLWRIFTLSKKAISPVGFKSDDTTAA